MLARYFASADCRERSLLAALGEEAPACGRCDNCRRPLRRMVYVARQAPGEARALARHLLHEGFAGFFRRAPSLEPDEAEEPAGAFAEPLAQPPRTVEQARRLRALREARLAIARKTGVAPARLIGDAALGDLVDAPPADLAEIISRCGDETGLLARFGAPLMACAEATRIFATLGDDSGPEL